MQVKNEMVCLLPDYIFHLKGFALRANGSTRENEKPQDVVQFQILPYCFPSLIW